MTVTVMMVNVLDLKVDCPHCGHTHEGWVVDPRGLTENCDECDKEFTIHPEADIEVRP